jgi:hypothetical protein
MDMEQNDAAPFIILGLIFIYIVLTVVQIVVYVLFIMTLQKALGRCAPINRTMSPGMVWLLLIPGFNLVWIFFVVLKLAKTLEQEFRGRGIPCEPEPGKTIGLIMCICVPCTFIPYVGILTGLASFVLWIVYWVKIASLSKKLVWVRQGI